MKSLIISLKTYDWIPHISGTILQEKNNDFELLRIFSDNSNSIFWCRNLCNSAIFEQRRYDLEKIGEFIKIKRAGSLNYNEDTFDSHHLKGMITKLRLFSMFNALDFIYIPNNLLFINIFKDLSKDIKSEIFLYGTDCNTDEIKRVILDREIYEDKLEIRKLMVGIHKKEDLDLYKPIERFYSIEKI